MRDILTSKSIVFHAVTLDQRYALLDRLTKRVLSIRRQRCVMPLRDELLLRRRYVFASVKREAGPIQRANPVWRHAWRWIAGSRSDGDGDGPQEGDVRIRRAVGCFPLPADTDSAGARGHSPKTRTMVQADPILT